MITDCMRSGLSCRLTAIAGSAVVTMVESSVCMKKPAATSHSSWYSDRLKRSKVLAAVTRPRYWRLSCR